MRAFSPSRVTYPAKTLTNRPSICLSDYLVERAGPAVLATQRATVVLYCTKARDQ